MESAPYRGTDNNHGYYRIELGLVCGPTHRWTFDYPSLADPDCCHAHRVCQRERSNGVSAFAPGKCQRSAALI